MAAFDRDTGRYNVTFRVMLDDTFTPAVISGIESLRTVRFEINAKGSVIPGTVASSQHQLDRSVEKGPTTLIFHYNSLPPLLDGHGYQLQVSKRLYLL